MFNYDSCILCGACADNDNTVGPVYWNPATTQIIFYSPGAQGSQVVGGAECHQAKAVDFELAKSHLLQLRSISHNAVVGCFFAEGGSVLVLSNNKAQFFGTDPKQGVLEEVGIDYYELED